MGVEYFIFLLFFGDKTRAGRMSLTTVPVLLPVIALSCIIFELFDVEY